jgi:DNA-binding beta-propeller fold protein YncE
MPRPAVVSILAAAVALAAAPDASPEAGPTVAKLDVTEYRMPDRRASDPHTPVFDERGMLWFTVQRANMVGRPDPSTGTIELREVPTPDATPYGMAIDHRGIPFFCEFGTNKLASIDPGTLQITEYPLPANARPRRLAITPDNSVYYSDYGRGYLGRFNPRTGGVHEWPSPGGPSSKPYGIAITQDGSVWYSESGVQPNTIVRFDPARQSFARTQIPSASSGTWPPRPTGASSSRAAARTRSGSSPGGDPVGMPPARPSAPSPGPCTRAPPRYGDARNDTPEGRPWHPYPRR